MAEMNVVWEEQGVSVCKLPLEEIAEVVAQDRCWVLPAVNVESRRGGAALMTGDMIFDYDWIRRLHDRQVADVTVVVISKKKAPTEAGARVLAKAARADWEEKKKEEETAARERVKVLTQKAKLACQKCAALVTVFKNGVSVFDDKKQLVTDPEVQKHVISLGLALESLAEVISNAIEALLNGDSSVLVKADQGLAEVSDANIHLALKSALDALAVGYDLGFKKQVLEEIFLAAFFSAVLRGRGGEYASRVYEVVRSQKPKIPDAALTVRHHERIEWMGFQHYVRQGGSRLVTLISGEELVKILLVGLTLEFNERVAAGETHEMILEDMGWRYKEPAAGPLYNPAAHVVNGLPPYSLAWSGFCNRLGLVPKKAIVEFTHKPAAADTANFRVHVAFKGNAAQYLGLLGGTGISLGHRPDMEFSPLIWLCWKKGGDGKYSVLAPEDGTSASSITSAASSEGELRRALLPIGLNEMNAQIYGPKRRRVVGLLDNANFAAIKNFVERTINIPQVLRDSATHHSSKKKNG